MTPPPIPTEVYERSDYNDLVRDGGRPLYPIELLEDVAKDPEAYRDMLLPWLHSPAEELDGDSHPWKVFGKQFWSWKQFRRWQTHSRREGRPRYVEVESRWVPVDRAYNVFVWEFRRGSSNYTETVKKLLAPLGFTRPFQFHEDPTQQDSLTTWIEYLGFEYALHYKYDLYVKEHQPDYDKAWKTLVDAKVLRPSDTEEYICDIEAAFQAQHEEDQAEKAVKRAKVDAMKLLISVRKDLGHPTGASARAEKMEAAIVRLNTAKESLKLVKRRNDCTTQFKIAVRNYLVTKRDAERHNRRVRWILKQVPLVEAELEESRATEVGRGAARGTKRRECDRDDEAEQDRATKKPRRSSGEDSPSLNCKGGSDSQKAETGTLGDETPSNRLRSGGQGPDSCESQPQAPHGQTKELSRKTHGDRIKKKSAVRRGAQSRRSALESAKAPTSGSGPNRSKRALDVVEELGGNATRTLLQPRRSRRLAGELPEYCRLSDQGKALPYL